MVATTDLGFCIKLEHLKQMHDKLRMCHYEPELFPGLIYRFEDDSPSVEPAAGTSKAKKRRNRVTLLIFSSGKVVFAGLKSRQKLNEVFSKMYPVLYLCRKKQLIQ